MIQIKYVLELTDTRNIIRNWKEKNLHTTTTTTTTW
jgi:hypothetical protein